MSLTCGVVSAAAACTVSRAFGPPAARNVRSRASFGVALGRLQAAQIASTTAGGVAMAVKATVSFSATVLLAATPLTV